MAFFTLLNRSAFDIGSRNSILFLFAMGNVGANLHPWAYEKVDAR